MDLGAGAYGIAIAFALFSLGIMYIIVKSLPPGNYETKAEKMACEINSNAEQLGEPAKITVVRKKNFVGAMASLNCYLNGNYVGSLGNGESIEFRTSQHRNMLHITDQAGVESQPYQLDLDAGNQATVFYNLKFLPKETIIGTSDNGFVGMPVHAPEIPEVPAEPKRVLWASVLMLLGFVFFQTLVTFPLRDIFNGYFPTGLAHLAFIAAFTVLFLIREKRSRVYGGIVVGFGFLYIIVSGLLWRQIHPANNLFLGIRDYFFQGIMAVGFGWLFTRSEYEKTKKINWLRAGIGAALSELILIVGIIVFVIKGVNLSLVINLILPIFCIWLFVLFFGKLSEMQSSDVHLSGLGLFWAWLSMIAMTISIISLVVLLANGNFAQYSFPIGQIMIWVFGAVGYLLMILKKRIGLYLILGAVLFGLTNVFADTFSNFFNGYISDSPMSILLPLLGLLNPWFAWLAVKAGDNN